MISSHTAQNFWYWSVLILMNLLTSSTLYDSITLLHRVLLLCGNINCCDRLHWKFMFCLSANMRSKLDSDNIYKLHGYCDMRLMSKIWAVIISWYDICDFFLLLFNSACYFLNLQDCSACSYTCLYQVSHYIHITNDYLQKCAKCQFSFLQYCHKINRGNWSKIP